MQEYISQFREILTQATTRIEDDYFHLPIASLDNPIYRERVYCYELYHQLRLLWPDDFNFRLNGEIDKRNHPFYLNTPLKFRKPDFLVHQPGHMEGNLIVMEVKSLPADNDGIKKDLRTISRFIKIGRYQQGIHLVYGGDGNQSYNYINTIKQLSQKIDLAGIEFYWHPIPGTQAVKFGDI